MLYCNCFRNSQITIKLPMNTATVPTNQSAGATSSLYSHTPFLSLLRPTHFLYKLPEPEACLRCSSSTQQQVSKLKAIEACDRGCWIWRSITQESFQAAEVIASVNGMSRSFLDARGLGSYEGKKLDSVSEVYVSDGIYPTIKPPPIDGGTPNESVADVFLRVTQLLSILETQYSEDTIIIISPDSDNLLILQAGLIGLDLPRLPCSHYLPVSDQEVTRHRELSFAPRAREVRFVDTSCSIAPYRQPASAVYKC